MTMNIFDPALPRLQQAHQLMWEVRQACHDTIMDTALRAAMEANQDAQRRLTAIDRDAKRVPA